MKTKRIMRIALTLVMLLGMLLGMSLTASAAGTTKTITPGTDDAKTGTGTMTITLIIKSDPAAKDFDVTLPTSLAYDGKAKTATAVAKSTVTGMGTITVEYYKDGTKVDSAVDVGEYTVKLEVADDGTHYNAGTVENTDWKFTITKGTPTVTAPTAKGLTYTGSAQELVNAGSTNDGKLYYAVTTENKAPTDENLYTTSIPTATNAGTYYVWYKVKGDANHTDTEPASITVTISAKEASVAYTVVSSAGTSHTIGSGKDAVITVERGNKDHREKELFTGAAMDGKAIPTDGYIAEQGSLILTLKASYLDTLSEGDHKVTVSFKDGKAEAPVKIISAVKPVPKTGDGADLALWLGLLAAGFAMALAAGKMKSRRSR